jgi:hypothetical protein
VPAFPSRNVLTGQIKHVDEETGQIKENVSDGRFVAD